MHQESDIRFFQLMSAFLLAVVIIGFSRSFYLQSVFEFPELPIRLHVHGAVLTTWFLIAFAQPCLIQTHRVSLHRKVGVVGVLVAVAVVFVSVMTLVYRDAPYIDERQYAAAPNLWGLFTFSTCVMFGILLRKRTDVHRRLMLLASIPIVAPALDRVGRIPSLQTVLKPLLAWFPAAAPVEVAFGFVGFLILVFTVVVFDLLSFRRVNFGTWLGLAAIFVIAPILTAALTLSGGWAAFVRMVTYSGGMTAPGRLRPFKIVISSV